VSTQREFLEAVATPAGAQTDADDHRKVDRDNDGIDDKGGLHGMKFLFSRAGRSNLPRKRHLPAESLC
jgi:hypothetical protein